MNIDFFIHQTISITKKLYQTPAFIWKNKLWEGFFRQKTVRIVTLIAAIIIPWSVYEYLQAVIPSISSALSENSALSLGSMKNSANISTVFDGGNKYIILVLIQMLVVYFSNKTIEKISGVTIDFSVKEMIGSVIRTLIVAVRNWVLELVLGILIAVIIGLFGPDFLSEGLKYILSSYFVGYLFLDNYNHTFGVGIAKSSSVIRRHICPAIVIGLVTQLLFLLPVAGPLIASFICSVGATWYMHTSEDRHEGLDAFV